jgi:uncharacterized protein YciW
VQQRKQPEDRKSSEFVTVRRAELEATQERWEETRRNQISVSNRLLGIIDLARETANSPSLSPEEALHKIKEILK